MASGRSMQLTQRAGEYLVCAELCRRGLISTTFAGNVPDFDILATNEQLQAIPIQVKTIRNGGWQFDAKRFLNISISGDIQTIEGKADLANPDLICVLVWLRQQKQDEFYVCRMRDLQRIVKRLYSRWLSKKEGKRPRNPESTHVALSPADLKHYQDRWETLVEQ